MTTRRTPSKKIVPSEPRTTPRMSEARIESILLGGGDRDSLFEYVSQLRDDLAAYKEANGDLSVCLCGCSMDEHENYGEDGDSCEHDDHVCLRVYPSVATEIKRLRDDLAASQAREAATMNALQRIREECGAVCAEYDTCQHLACRSSYTSWAIADEALQATQKEMKV